MLDGEIIRHLHLDPSLRKVSAGQIVGDAIYADGGPMIHNDWKRSNAPSIRPAASSIASSLNPSDKPASHPQILGGGKTIGRHGPQNK